jgi:competence protein ComEC
MNLRPRARSLPLPGVVTGAGGVLALIAQITGRLRLSLAEERDRRSPFLWLPVAFGLGIMAYFEADREPALWAGPVLAALLVLPAIRLAGLARIVVLALLFAALGFSAASWRTARVGTPILERAGLYEVTGFVEQVDQGPRRHRITLHPGAIGALPARQLPERIRVGASGVASVKPGDTVRLQARLAPPSEAAMPGGYDFRREAYFRQMGASGFVIGRVSAAEKPTSVSWDRHLHAMIDGWRNGMTERISRVIGGDAGALAAALVTGKRGLIPDETNDELRASGLYHIVSISGLHMVLAAGIFFWIARACLAAIPAIALRYPIKKIAAGLAMLGATFYCLFSGSEVATERSLVMTLVMLGAILFDRPALAMRNLAISALIVLAREPEALLGPSFQMSFAAVACLIAANEVWQDWRSRTVETQDRSALARGFTKLGLAFLGILATTLVASLATAPFSAWHFHRLNPLGVIGNALAIPLVSLVVMPAAVLGSLLLPFGLDGIVWAIMGEGVRGVLLVAGWVAAFEGAVVPVPRIALTAHAMLVLALLLFIGFRTRLRAVALLPLLAAVPFAGQARLPDLLVDPEGRMVMLRGEGGRYRLLNVASPSSFTLQQWLPALGDGRAPNDPSLREGTRCDRNGCIGRLADGRLISLAASALALREDCARADIVITPLAISSCASEARLISRLDSTEKGALRIFTPMRERWVTDSALDPSRERPWRKQHLQPSAPPATPSPREAIAQ